MKSLSKIQSPDSLVAWRRECISNETVAVVAGTFDLFQPGNLYAIRKAACEARHVVIVVLPPDHQDGERPVRPPQNPLVARVEMVSQVRDVSAVTSIAEDQAEGFLSDLSPFVWVTPDCGLSGVSLRNMLSRAASRTVAIPPLPLCFTPDIIKAMEQHRTPVVLPLGWDSCPRLRDSRHGESGVRVTVNGCFDILHVGHLRFLAEARAMGDSLTVLINSDASVARYKGPTRPVFPESFRSAALQALSMVDEVVVFAGDNPLDEIRQLRPMIHVKGGSYEPDRVRQERELVESWGGKLVCTPMVDGFSTTRFINEALKKRSGSEASPS